MYLLRKKGVESLCDTKHSHSPWTSLLLRFDASLLVQIKKKKNKHCVKPVGLSGYSCCRTSLLSRALCSAAGVAYWCSQVGHLWWWHTSGLILFPVYQSHKWPHRYNCTWLWTRPLSPLLTPIHDLSPAAHPRIVGTADLYDLNLQCWTFTNSEWFV